MAVFVPTEVFPPGTTILNELEVRGWTQTDLAEVMGRPLKTISGIVNAKVRITEETAKELELALGIDADFWLRTEAYYRLHSRAKASAGSAEEARRKAIVKRAQIRQRVPLRLMANRGWISLTDDPDELQARVEAFLEGPLDKPVAFSMAAKQTSYEEQLSPEQEVWLLRAKQLADALQVPTYSRANLLRAVDQMRGLLRSPEDAQVVPRLLTDAGVRFVVVERLPGLKIDGVCFWIRNGASPVIAMSLTRDRIDNFWFVLRHEIEHVLNGDGRDGAFVVDNDLDQALNVSDQEAAANSAASDFCVSQIALDDFMKRKGPLFTDTNVQQFAYAVGVHPGLVAGQIRRRLSQGPMGNDAWKRHASLLAKIRHVVVSAALVDGFGSAPQLA